jgi:hypothetical protein
LRPGGAFEVLQVRVFGTIRGGRLVDHGLRSGALDRDRHYEVSFFGKVIRFALAASECGLVEAYGETFRDLLRGCGRIKVSLFGC